MSAKYPFEMRWADGTRTEFRSPGDHIRALLECQRYGHDDGRIQVPGGFIWACWRCWTTPWVAEVGMA